MNMDHNERTIHMTTTNPRMGTLNSVMTEPDGKHIQGTAELDLDRRKRGTGEAEKAKHRVHSRIQQQHRTPQGPTRQQGYLHRIGRMGVRRYIAICFPFVSMVVLVLLVGKSFGPLLERYSADSSPYTQSQSGYKEGGQSSSSGLGGMPLRNSEDASIIDNSKSELLNPFKSQPPQSIDLLFQISSPAIQNRHKCIQAIRDRHMNILGPLIRRDNGNGAGAAALLVDPAYHKNVGDHMITLGELEFLRRLGFIEPQMIQQCGYLQAESFVDTCDDFLQSTPPRPSLGSSFGHQTALWHGGGNWGDLWPTMQPLRIGSFALLLQKNYSIVGMPQSLYYSDKSLGKIDTARLKRSISSGLGFGKSERDTEEGRKTSFNRVHLAWREVESYTQAQELYPFVTNLLVPDIAFQLGPYKALPPRAGTSFDVDLLFFLRDDHESTLSEYRKKAAIRGILESIPGADGLKIMIVDWIDRLELFESQDHFFTDTSIQLLSMGRVVICDRLHAAILCYLSGIPFVYIDQSTGKISKSLRVAFDSLEGCKDGDVAMWAGAKTFQAAVETAIGFLKKYNLQTTRLGRARA